MPQDDVATQDDEASVDTGAWPTFARGVAEGLCGRLAQLVQAGPARAAGAQVGAHGNQLVGRRNPAYQAREVVGVVRTRQRPAALEHHYTALRPVCDKA